MISYATQTGALLDSFKSLPKSKDTVCSLSLLSMYLRSSYYREFLSYLIIKNYNNNGTNDYILTDTKYTGISYTYSSWLSFSVEENTGYS